jgi:hypothetical protein
MEENIHYILVFYTMFGCRLVARGGKRMEKRKKKKNPLMCLDKERK